MTNKKEYTKAKLDEIKQENQAKLKQQKLDIEREYIARSTSISRLGFEPKYVHLTQLYGCIATLAYEASTQYRYSDDSTHYVTKKDLIKMYKKFKPIARTYVKSSTTTYAMTEQHCIDHNLSYELRHPVIVYLDNYKSVGQLLSIEWFTKIRNKVYSIKIANVLANIRAYPEYRDTYSKDRTPCGCNLNHNAGHLLNKSTKWYATDTGYNSFTISSSLNFDMPVLLEAIEWRDYERN